MTSSPPLEDKTIFYGDIQLEAGLYLVPTPIGNMRDISLRALDTLNAANIIACEDTRITGKLLKFYNITTPMLSYYEHNAAKRRPEITARINSGEAVALVSDAGTPLISDPGFRLVKLIRDEGLKVTALPGANAAITALSMSGLPSSSFCFAGFLPSKKGARCRMLEKRINSTDTLIYYETAPRLLKALKDISELMENRQIAIGRELTKYYEELQTGTAAELITYYTNRPPKGEIVLLIAPEDKATAKAKWDDAAIDKALIEALNKGQKPRAAALEVAALSGQKSRILYSRAITLKSK